VTGSILCKPYWDGQGYDPPQSVSPFEGGQCINVSYKVDVFRNQSGGQVFTAQLYARGPITELSKTFLGNFQYRMKIVGSTGFDQRDVGVLADEAPPSFGPIQRQDNQPDTCGNPEGDLQPGDNPPPTPTFPPGEEPGVDDEGQPFFFVPPIDDPTGSGDPVPVPEPSPDGGGGAGGGPTEPPVAGDEEEGSEGDEEFPPPEEGRRWVGCCIRLTSIPVGTGTVPGTSPETILTQVVGNARLLFDSVTGDGYDTPVQIRSAGLCLWEPVKGLSPKGVRVNLKPGFSYAYTPYSVPEEQ
jgi:hypothetical protein